jgi:hypothetical protein
MFRERKNKNNNKKNNNKKRRKNNKSPKLCLGDLIRRRGNGAKSIFGRLNYLLKDITHIAEHELKGSG